MIIQCITIFSVVRSNQDYILTEDEINELMSNKELMKMLDETIEEVKKEK